MKHLLVTRASFDDDTLFNEYLPVIKDVFIPCLANQTNKNFNICAIVKEKHKAILENEFKKVNLDAILLIGNTETYNKWVLTQQYDIQTRHDCDDWMSSDYVEIIQNEYVKNIGKFEEFLVYAQPVKMDYTTKFEYRMAPYPTTRTSMFLSLCQRECKKSIMQEQHGNFPKLVPNVIDIGYGYTKWIAHGHNISAKIYGSDVKIEKVTIVTSVFGNLGVVKSCMDTWFPLPFGWELLVYDNKVSEIDGTSAYLDEIQKTHKFTIVRDGKIRSHPEAINLLLDKVKTEWVLHLDSDVELLDRKFYAWAERTLGKVKEKAWGLVEKYNASKFKQYPETPNYYTLHLPRAATYVLLFNKKFYDDKKLDFGNTIIEGGKIIRGKGDIIGTNEYVPDNSMTRVTGDTGWKIYWEFNKHGMFAEFFGEIWRCWNHKEASSRKWMRENSEKIKQMREKLK